MTLYNVEKVSKGNTHKIALLYIKAFNKRFSKQYVENKFLDPYQGENHSFVAFDGETAISYYGVIKQKAIFNGELVTLYQSCDSMTDPKYSGKGLFLKLANLTYDELRGRGISFIFGFPNARIYGLRLNKLNWQHEENIYKFQFNVLTIPLAKINKKITKLNFFYQVFVKSILKKYLSKELFFENSCSSQNNSFILHDYDYFKYKSSNDKYLVNILGVNLWLKIDGFLWIGDMEFCTEDKFLQVLKRIKFLARVLGCSNIVFYYQEGTNMANTIIKVKEPTDKLPLGYLKINSDEKTKFNFKFCGADFDSW